MNTPLLLLVCACSIGQPTSRTEWQLAPQLAPGLELVYVGTYTEESLVPNVQFQRNYQFESRLFVLNGRAQSWDIAVMTSLSQREGGLEPGPKKLRLCSVRMEVGQVDSQGRFHDATGAVPLLPLAGPPTFEAGCFVEGAPPRLVKGTVWEVNEDVRPPRSWQVAGLEAVNGVTCVKIVGQQTSLDWDRPRADQTAWRRRDLLWINPQLGVAEKVERVIERRDPARRDPTQRLTIAYELKNRFRYPGQLYEDRKLEIAKIKRFQDDAAGLLRQTGPMRSQIDALISKVSHHLEDPASTPYRQAVFHLKTRLEDAKAGKAPIETAPDENPRPATTVNVGQRVPDFVVHELSSKQSARLSRYLGRPVLVCFYIPGAETGKEVLRFAKDLVQQHGDRVGIMAMAVTNDAAAARKQQNDLQLPFAILDGRGMHLTFGVEATPRLVLLDSDGTVRAAYTGWGAQVPREIQDELQRWLRK